MAGETGNGRILICKMCGKEYHSRGINDPGYCKECERALREAQSSRLGGPLYGQKVGEKR